MHIFLKAGFLVVVGTGLAGVGGYYWFFNKETIGSAIGASLKSHKKVLSSKTDKVGEEWKKVYEASNKKIEKITKDTLPQGCEDTLKLPNKDKKNYDLAFKGCVVNTNTLQTELLSLKGISVLTVGASDEKGQKAGKHHNNKKAENNKLAISDDTVTKSNLSETTGAAPLHKGCTDRYSGPVYKLNAESEMAKVEKGCSESAGNFSG